MSMFSYLVIEHEEMKKSFKTRGLLTAAVTYSN